MLLLQKQQFAITQALFLPSEKQNNKRENDDPASGKAGQQQDKKRG
jgi:hypothetical protein